jgi:hypothetical protein
MAEGRAMRALVIGETEKAKIAELRQTAAANVMDAAAMRTASGKDIRAYRQMMEELSIELPRGFLVTYSHDRHPDPYGVVRHISVSVDRANRVPHPAAVDMILEAFGMQPIGESVSVWIEDVGKREKAINVVQRL